MQLTDRKQQLFIAIILLGFASLSFAASTINPPHEATDELRHYRFVRQLATARSLPVQGKMGCSAQGHHPPLYYAMAALLTSGIDTGRDLCYDPPHNPFWAYRYWEVGVDNKAQYLHSADEQFPWSGEALAVHLARAVNVLIGTLTVYLTYLIGRAIWPKRPFLALGGTAFIAFNPMFVYMAGAINNDIIAALAGAAITLACVRLLRDENGLSRRWGIIFGALYGLALMSKFNLAIIGLSVAMVVTYTAVKRKQYRLWLEVGLIAAGITTVIASWWFVRNQLLYGEPTGVQKLTELWGVRDPFDPDSWGTAIFELSYAWSSLWGRFGYGQIPLPDFIYDGLKAIAAIAFAGLLVPIVRRDKTEWRESGIPLLLLLFNVILFFGVLFGYLLISPAGPMGRFFFPALPSLSILLFYGLTRWTNLFMSAKWTALAVNLGMAALTIIALFGYLRPAYALPMGWPSAEGEMETAVTFGNFATLDSYSLSSSSVHPGGFVDIDLFWDVIADPPGNYILFVHLIDEDGIMVAQRDTHTGLGRLPSGQWQTGDQFVDSVRLYLPETAYEGKTAVLSIGLYAPSPESYRLGIAAKNGDHLGDALSLGEIAIASQADGLSNPHLPNQQAENFNNELMLAGFEYNEQQFMAGDELIVDLYWQPLPAWATEYEARVQLVGNDGRVLMEKNGRLPHPATTDPDTIINSTHPLPIPNDITAGNYTIHVTLIDVSTQKPQNIVAEDGHLIDDRLSLPSVNIR